jgi:hypothetical protein
MTPFGGTMRFAIMAVAFLMLSPLLCSQEPPKTLVAYPGFYTAEEFLQLSDVEKAALSSGFVDGLFVGPYFGGPQPNKMVQALSTCMGGMTNTQVAAIIEKQIKGRPEQWHRPFAMEALNAVITTCPAMK